MLTSLAFVFLAGLAAAAACRRLRLPPIIGMLAVGAVLGPSALDLLDGSILSISAELRQMALVIILLKAGLSLDLADLKRVGRPAVLLAFVPASCEIAAYPLLAPALLGVSRVETAVLGTAPLSILTGAALGAAAGWALSAFFETACARRHTVRNSVKVIVVLGVAFLLLAAQDWLEGRVPLSGLLAVMSMACALRARCAPGVSARLGQKFGKLWLAAELLLFVLVGAAVDLRYALAAGPGVLAMIALALVFRAAGVALCLARTGLDRGERLFCVVAYLPKATVQAAIGSVPLAAGLACGELVLAVAVTAILLTAPLGALGMDLLAPRLLGEKRRA